jgi:hypothetical protein
MILTFPDLDTLRLALTSGIVPPAVSLAPTAAGLDDGGQVWLQPSAAPSRAVLAELRRLKVQTPRNSSVPLTERYDCWLQVLPVQRSADQGVPPEQAPVLFDLAADQLSGMVTEILRLGNDRQSFRFWKNGRVLLRVVGPPYYSLLRALDRDGAENAPLAYVESAPRLWTRIGCTHPLGGQIKVPEGKVLLLQPPRQWAFLADTPFRDIYELLEFELPQSKVAWRDGGPPHRVRVPLRLTTSDPSDAAELWVLRERPLEQLDELVSNCQDDLLRQLSFAVAEKDGQQIIVLRARPTKGPRPELVLGAVEFRRYQKLPNLFLPSGKRLHPPLSHHVIRNLLAGDPAVITWLCPHGDGTFTPESLPDEAFRPLADWIDYILDHEQQALQTWVESHRFDFEPFVCGENAPAKPRKPPGSERDRASLMDRGADRFDADTVSAMKNPEKEIADDTILGVEQAVEVAQVEPDVLQEELRRLEERFLAVDGGLGVPERQALWPEMARLHAALKHAEDAGVCWMNALWTAETPTPDLAGSWFRSEASGIPEPLRSKSGRESSWAAAAAMADIQELSGADLDRLLAQPEPTTADVRALAAYLVWAAAREPAPPPLAQRLVGVSHFLEKNERSLPVRAVWLAWTSLGRLSGGDVLGLARARDRLLERLYQNGLRLEQDLASFMHPSAAGANGARLRAFRHWMMHLADMAIRWLERVSKARAAEYPDAATPAYGKLILAFALASLGESDTSRVLLGDARKLLENNKDDIHRILFRLFAYRVEQALQGKQHKGPLPEELLRELQNKPVLSRLVVERMRELSRILEPDQIIQAYRHWEASKNNKLEVELSEIQDLTDRSQVAQRLLGLLESPPHDTTTKETIAQLRARILSTAFALGPLVGEEFTVALLRQVGKVCDGLSPSTDEHYLPSQVRLLEKALFSAKHFDQQPIAQNLVARFQGLLQTQVLDEEGIKAVESVVSQCFHGLRKLGMRDEMDLLLGQIARVLLDSQKVSTVHEFLQKAIQEKVSSKSPTFLHVLTVLRALLNVAAGWFYFGRDQQALPVLKAARVLLFQCSSLLDDDPYLAVWHTGVACAYVAALGQAPVEMAKDQFEELFRKIDLRDNYTTNQYYGLFQLQFVEAVVRAIVSDDAKFGDNVRRWLDEDEFLVRRRIHADMRAALARQSS